MMQLYGALILCVTLSAACGLKCYSCNNADPKSCTSNKTCPDSFDRCYTLTIEANGLKAVTKDCATSASCVSAVSSVGTVSCCDKDLCNSAIPTGPSAILLLVSSAILKFLF